MTGALCGLWMLAAAAHSADLMQAYSLAQANDVVIESARFALQASQQKVPQARSSLLPSLGLNGSLGDTKGSTVYTGTPDVTRSFKNYVWALQLTQPVYRVDTYWSYDAAKASAVQAEAQFAQTRQDLILRVAQAYFDVVVAEEALEAAAAQVSALKEQEQAASRSYAAGVASVTDADDSRSRAALAESQRVAAVDDLDSKRAVLMAITGTEMMSLAVVDPSASLPSPKPHDLRQWLDEARQSNPNVLAARAGLEAAEFELKRTRALRLPNVDFVAQYGGNYSSGNIVNPANYSTRVRDGQVSLQLSIPIVDGGGLQGQVGEARAKQRKAEADLEIARRQAALDAQQAFGGVINGLAQVEALKVAVSAGTNAVKGNRIGYGMGIRINNDVLNAEQQLYSARRDLAKARYDTLLQGLRLKSAAGELGDAEVEAINRMLVPNPRVASTAEGRDTPAQ